MTLQNNNSSQEQHFNNRLSVQFSLSGLSFLVTDSISKEVVFFSEKKYTHKATPEELLIDLQSFFSENSELQETFNQVNVIYATNLYSVVPSNLFDESKASEYLKFNSKILSNDYIAFDELESKNLTIVYIPFVNINNYMFDRFGNFNYYHSTTIFLKQLLTQSNLYSLPRVYINVLSTSFDLIIIKEKEELLLCNTYDFKTPEDFIYYILFSLEQLKLNPGTLEFIVSGLINEGDDNYTFLYNYIRNISFNTIKYDKVIIDSKGSKEHHHFLLKLASL